MSKKRKAERDARYPELPTYMARCRAVEHTIGRFRVQILACLTRSAAWDVGLASRSIIGCSCVGRLAATEVVPWAIPLTTAKYERYRTL